MRATVRPVPSSPVAQRLMAALEEILEAERTGDYSRMIIHRLTVPEPAKYTPKAVRAIRMRIGISRGFFAELMGVSTSTIESWENGVRQPRPIARRLLDEIARDPERWRRLVRRSA